VHAAYYLCVDILVESMVGEALAAFHLVEFCRNWGFSRIYLEADSLIVIQAINRTCVFFFL
jgi:phosphoenolpyruvate synthase/pyruvate phosphate dikinase